MRVRVVKVARKMVFRTKNWVREVETGVWKRR